ncbi:Tn3 family transposase [Klebsiella pneumoniae]
MARSLQYRSGTTNQSNLPALTRHRLNWTKANYLRAETITSANARLVDFGDAPLAQIWGGGEVASADGMRFVTPVAEQ